jgi:polar amino acid transport system substrate-binding protein
MVKARRLMAVLFVFALVVGVVGLVGCSSSTTTTTAAPATTGAPSTATTAAPTSTDTTAVTPTTASGAFDVTKVQADPAINAMLPANIKSAGTMKVASDIPYPPWEMFVGTTSQATGFDYDLSQAVAAKMGIKADFVETKFDSIILSIQSGKNDVGMSDMYDNKTRQKTMDFVDYANDGTSILVAKGNPKGVTTLDSLAGQTVAVEKGATQATLLENLNKTFASSGKKAMTINQYPDQPSALLAVKSGKAVGDLTDHSTAEYIAQSQGGGNDFDVVADPAAPNGYDPQLVGAAILKTNTQLRDAYQKALQALIDDGTYKQIIDKYGLLPVTSAQVNQGTGA